MVDKEKKDVGKYLKQYKSQCSVKDELELADSEIAANSDFCAAVCCDECCSCCRHTYSITSRR